MKIKLEFVVLCGSKEKKIFLKAIKHPTECLGKIVEDQDIIYVYFFLQNIEDQNVCLIDTGACLMLGNTVAIRIDIKTDVHFQYNIASMRLIRYVIHKYYSSVASVLLRRTFVLYEMPAAHITHCYIVFTSEIILS